MRHPNPPHDPDHVAALITLVILRFAGAQPSGPPGGGVPGRADGIDRFSIFPAGTGHTAEDLVGWFVYQPKPLVVGPLHDRGSIAVWTGDEIGPRIAPAIEYELRNQRELLPHMIGDLDLAGQSPIELETPGDFVRFSLADLTRWTETYLVSFGWNVGQDDPDAPVRMRLFGPDGHNTLGGGF